MLARRRNGAKRPGEMVEREGEGGRKQVLSPDDDDGDDDVRKINKFLQGGRRARSLSKASVFSEGGNRRRFRDFPRTDIRT